MQSRRPMRPRRPAKKKRMRLGLTAWLATYCERITPRFDAVSFRRIRLCCRLATFGDAAKIAHDAVQLKILRRIDTGDSGFFERDGILRRDDAADDDRNVRDAGFFQTRKDRKSVV